VQIKPRWDPLGVTPDGSGGANVALWAQGADRVELCILNSDGEERIELPERINHVFHAHVSNLPIGTRYGFRVHGEWNPAEGLRWNPHKLLLDPYARAITGEMRLDPAIFDYRQGNPEHMNTTDSAPVVPHSVVVDNSFDWQGDQAPETPWTDTVIYETHVKGMTQAHPDIPKHLRGTYSGLAHPVVVEHLLALGVTAVELLPIHHFVNEIHLLESGLTNYWGYNSIGFFAPHAAYASRGSRGEQVSEFKEMVRTLHSAGLEVILDVVYNHTAEGGADGPTLSFRGIDNDDYYRLGADRYSYIDYTGCGNTLNASNAHVLQMIMDSLRYWVTEMHVDGFRFDLASALARSLKDVDMLSGFLTSIHQDPVLRTTKLIAEPWDVSPGGYQVGGFPVLWAEWNDKYRDSVRNFWRGTGHLPEVGWRLSGSADLYASERKRPQSSINFITAHDGFTLRDLVTYEHKHNLANGEDNRDGTDNNISANYGHEGETSDPFICEVRRRQMRNFASTLLLSLGVPMISGGDEIGRTQHGNNNAYCQDNEISWFDWELAPWQRDLAEFYSGVASIRKNHRVFRRHTFFSGAIGESQNRKDLTWMRPDGHEMSEHDWDSSQITCLGMYLFGRAHEDDKYRPWSDTNFLLVMNTGLEDHEFRLPGAPFAHEYSVAIDTEAGYVQPEAPLRERILAAETVLRVGARTLILLEAHEPSTPPN
jgi:glycogen operon protein